MESGKKVALAREWLRPALKQWQLANLLDVDTSTVGRWEATGHIPKGRVQDVAKALGVDPDWLTDGSDDLPDVAAKPAHPSAQTSARDSRPEPRERRSFAGTILKPVKVVGYVSAGPGAANVDEEHGEVYVPRALYEIGGVGWIVDGMSMANKLLPGDVALFREYRNPKPRMPFLIKTKAGEFRVKRLVWLEGRWHLESINPEFPTEPMQDGDELLGFLVGWYRAKGSRETLDSDPDGLTLLDD